ncbi:MAG: type II toxin-antitoxin system PemK/MazF family toxin [Spirulina sp.]
MYKRQNLNPVKGREQAGNRPCLIISVDLFNQGASGLVIVLPLTSKEKGIPFHVEVLPPEGGLKMKSFIKTEDIRSIFITPTISFGFSMRKWT